VPEIAARVVPAKSREAGNTATHKRFTGGELVMTGANAASSLRSTPARFLVMDEIDAFPLDVEGEGDPIALAVQRTVTYRGRRQILMISTPTIKGFSRIEAAYLESDQRRFFVSCLHCAHAFTVAWKDIRWPKGKPEDAACVCPECGGVHEEREKPTLLRGGNWQATAPGDGRTRGYHLPALLSPFETWAEIAAEHGRVAADPARLKSWVNTKLGETCEEEAAQTVDSGALSRRVEHWGEGLPPGVAVITAGIDTQDEWLAVELVGWGAGEESWSLGWHRLYGDLTVMLPEGIGYGWDYQPGNLWERGLVPSALIDEGGGLIHVGRHAVQIDPPAPLQDLLDAAKPFSARPLPEAGLSDEDYVRAFLQPFGADIGRAALWTDAAGHAVPISEELFRARDGRWKVGKRGRARLTPLMAEALIDPDEIWLGVAAKPDPLDETIQELLVDRRYIRVDPDLGIVVVMEVGRRWWEPITVYDPTKKNGQPDPKLLDRRRGGKLLWKRK
jgi:hypothetical protein